MNSIPARSEQRAGVDQRAADGQFGQRQQGPLLGRKLPLVDTQFLLPCSPNAQFEMATGILSFLY
jgi:hypothetical protein